VPAYIVVETDIHDPEQYERYEQAGRAPPRADARLPGSSGCGVSSAIARDDNHGTGLPWRLAPTSA